MSLDDLPTTNSPRGGADAGPVVRRVDRASPQQTKVTRAEELRLQLADEIIRGALAPGAALDETDIARRFNVSRTPVREALRQLAASGLVDARAHRGAVVARPSIERLTGMFEAMAELEALCAGLAAERMLPVERHRLEAVHEELRVLSYAGNPDRFHEVNERFHNAIYAGSQNGYIAEMTLATRVRVQPFRRAQFRNLGRLAKSHAEHDRVVVAIMRGDKVAGAVDVGGFDDKSFHAAAILQTHRPDRQRRRDRGDEFSERCRRQRPELQLDRRSRTLLHAQHAGFWRHGGKRIEPVVRRG